MKQVYIENKYITSGECIGLCIKNFTDHYNNKEYSIGDIVSILADHVNREYLKPVDVYYIDSDKKHNIEKGDWYVMKFDYEYELMYCYDNEEAERCNTHYSIKDSCFKILASTDIKVSGENTIKYDNFIKSHIL